MSRAEEFAEKVREALDCAFGPGTASVTFTGIDPEDVQVSVFEVEVRPMFGVMLGLKSELLGREEAMEQGAVETAVYAAKNMAPDFMLLGGNLQNATPAMFVPSPEQEMQQVADAVLEAVEEIAEEVSS